MHPLLSAIFTNRPALTALRAHLKSVEKSAARWSDALSAAQRDLAGRAASLDATFWAAPSAAKIEAMIAHTAQGAAVAQVVGSISAGIDGRRKSAIGTAEGRAKLRLAYDEIRAGLEERRRELMAEDATRSAKLGVTVSTAEAFELLDGQQRLLEDGSRWIDSNPGLAVSALLSVVGNE